MANLDTIVIEQVLGEEIISVMGDVDALVLKLFVRMVAPEAI